MGLQNGGGCSRSWEEDIYWTHFQFIHFTQFLRANDFDQQLVTFLFFHFLYKNDFILFFMTKDEILLKVMKFGCLMHAFHFMFIHFFFPPCFSYFLIILTYPHIFFLNFLFLASCYHFFGRKF